MTTDTKIISKLNSKISAQQGKINALQSELDGIKSAKPNADGCDYCLRDKEIETNNIIGAWIVESEIVTSEYEHIKINYCPMCGRKLCD